MRRLTTLTLALLGIGLLSATGGAVAGTSKQTFTLCIQITPDGFPTEDINARTRIDRSTGALAPEGAVPLEGTGLNRSRGNRPVDIVGNVEGAIARLGAKEFPTTGHNFIREWGAVIDINTLTGTVHIFDFGPGSQPTQVGASHRAGTVVILVGLCPED